MKEATYVSMLSHDIEKEIGGQVIKTADKSTLGLPDSSHILNGVITYLEAKIGTGEEIIDGISFIQPWEAVKKDLRQFEVCKEISKNALVLFCIYYPNSKISAIVTIKVLDSLRKNPRAYFVDKNYIIKGRGLEVIRRLMTKNREEVHENTRRSS